MTGILLVKFFEFHESHPKFWRLLAWENLLGGTTLTEADWQNIRVRYMEHLRELFLKGREDGHFSKDIDFSIYMLTIFSVTYFYHSNWRTVSHLLDLKLDSSKLQKEMLGQVNLMLTSGLTAGAKL